MEPYKVVVAMRTIPEVRGAAAATLLSCDIGVGGN